MSFGLCCRRLAKQAPRIAGAVLLVSLAFTSTSCGKKAGTPAWDTPGDRPLAVAEPARSPAATAKPARAKTPATPPPAAANSPGSATGGLRFIAYNVENWLTMDRFVGRKALKNSPKPDSEKKAVIQILVRNTPDVVGLCEIGEAKDLAEIQRDLKAAGLELPYSHYTGGSDPVRHLGLLSRFPITPAAQPAATEYQMKGQTFAINRGILDATVQTAAKSYRLLGVHLKSKREIEGIDQEEMRLHEARLLRRHVDSILLTNAQSRLIVYGDFNDTRPSKTFKTVTGNYNDPAYLIAIPLKDSRGEAWTHYWELHDIYSRFDFVAVTRALKPEVDFRTCRLIEDPLWIAASDHRPLLTIFK